MSWEGYEVVVCRDCGALGINHDGCLSMFVDDACSKCGSTNVDIGVVDETNGIPYYLSFRVKIVEDGKYETCECCGHTREVYPPKYKMIKCPTYKSNTYFGDV